MYIIKESKKIIQIIKLTSHESKEYKASGKIFYKGSIGIEDKEIFYAADKKNIYQPNDLANSFGIKNDPGGGSFSFLFDYKKVDKLEKFLKSKGYSTERVDGDTVEFIRDSIKGLQDHYNRTKDKNDKAWFYKNLRNIYIQNDVSDGDIETFNFTTVEL